MGNYVNKFFPYNNGIEKEEIRNASSGMKSDINIEQESMLTPPLIQKRLEIDPRSITTGIERTPIEVNSTPVRLNRRIISAIPKHLQTKPYLETDIDKVMACLTPKKHFPSKVPETTKLQFPDMQNEHLPLTPIVNNVNSKKKISPIQKERYEILGIDPRSPAANFDRTPILMPKSIERLKARSQEMLHRQGSYETDIFYPKFSYCEMSSQFNVPEIQVLPDLAACTAKSLDLNNTECNDRLSEPELSDSSDSSEIETISKNVEKPLEDQNKTETLLEQSNCNDVCIKRVVEHKEINISDDIIKVWKDTVVLNKLKEFESDELDNGQIVQKRISQVPKEDVIITFDDSSIVKDVLSLKISNCENNTTKIDTVTRKKRIKSDIKTDEKKVFSSNDKNDNEAIKTRTPLGNRSNNGQMQMLSTKSPPQIYKNKGVTPKMLQENTPPHKKYVTKSKLNGIQWDPDSTVVI